MIYSPEETRSAYKIKSITNKISLFQSKLVYEGHIYTDVPLLSDLPYEEFDLALTALQSFVSEAGHEYSAPFWMGEFGTGSDSENWRKILRFIKEHDLDWGYWPIDGYEYNLNIKSYAKKMRKNKGSLSITFYHSQK